ncbi:MAG: aminoacyl-histidine dipeptidase [Lachnospiraceae bacterium]|nr:aminoacyl-histidine dipeptidase [Lachnospiraceae bacterium]
MGVLSNLEPNNVFKFFEDICSIPHGSTNVKQISDYLVRFAKERNLKCRQDEKYNVIIWKDGSKGYENSPAVILQGHMDMVAVKVDGCDKDMAKEGLDLEINGDLISAKDTSLGGDNGIAVAYALAILDSDEIAHPPIEAIFTVDEEIGMLGADFIDVSDLKGRIFLNMDSEDEGIFTVSCAGGASAICSIPYGKVEMSTAQMKIRLDGFLGGHSGVEIDKGRLNANKALGRVLLALSNKIDIQLVTLSGGEKDNAIAKFSEAVVAVPEDLLPQAKDAVEQTFAKIQEEYKAVEPSLKLSTDTMETKSIICMAKTSTKAVIMALVTMPNGIQRMNPEMEGMVQTSLNLGIMKTEEEYVVLSFAVRSSSQTEKEYLIDKLCALTGIFGGTVQVVGNYPGWEYKADSKLRTVMVEAYKEQSGEEAVIEGIHAGLECGIFASKLPGLDAISFGPQMRDVHTTNEVLSISSTKRTWELLLKTLAKLK